MATAANIGLISIPKKGEKHTGGNRTYAARILGISRRTLQLKLKEYGINPS